MYKVYFHTFPMHPWKEFLIYLKRKQPACGLWSGGRENNPGSLAFLPAFILHATEATQLGLDLHDVGSNFESYITFKNQCSRKSGFMASLDKPLNVASLGPVFWTSSWWDFNRHHPPLPLLFVQFTTILPLLSCCTPDLVTRFHYLPDVPKHVPSWQCMAGRKLGRMLNRKQRLLEACSWNKSPPPF